MMLGRESADFYSTLSRERERERERERGREGERERGWGWGVGERMILRKDFSRIVQNFVYQSKI